MLRFKIDFWQKMRLETVKVDSCLAKVESIIFILAFPKINFIWAMHIEQWWDLQEKFWMLDLTLK